MSDEKASPGPKTKQGLIFVAVAAMFTLLSTVVFEGSTSTVMSICAVIIAICGGVLIWQGSTEDRASA